MKSLALRAALAPALLALFAGCGPGEAEPDFSVTGHVLRLKPALSTSLPEATLERVAELTGGAYFQAMDREQLAQAYAEIAALEPELYESTSFRPRHSLHHIPIALILLYYTVYHVSAGLIATRQRRPLDAQ